jgi:hypothetical protein
MVYSGSSKNDFCEHLGGDWKRLADHLEINPAEQDKFIHGEQARGIWDWLERRSRLSDLPGALVTISRGELAERL